MANDCTTSKTPLSNYFDLTLTPSPPPTLHHLPSPPCSIEIPTVYSKQSNPTHLTTTTEPSTYLSISDDDDHNHNHQQTTAIGPSCQPTLSSTSTSSTADAEEVERSLLLHTNLQPSSPSSPSPPLRFLPSDIKLLNVYLCKPISTVMATCSSLILPPLKIPGLPLGRLETLYARDPWRINHESIGVAGLSKKVSCWIYGKGWPAKTFIISGWLVGIDRREKFITYHVDDGTAVLECQIHVTQLNQAFDTGSQDHLSLPHEKKTPIKSKGTAIQDISNLPGNSTGSAFPPKNPREDPRLDAYRRMPSSDQKLHPRTSTTLQSKINPELRKPLGAATEPVTEETIAKCAALKVGVVLRLVGQPKSLFRDTKRVFDLEKIIVFQGNNQAEEEIRFRNHLRFCRSNVYNLPFRLANVWPEGLITSNPGNHRPPFFPDRPAALKNKPSWASKLDEKGTSRLKLTAVSNLKPSQITFSSHLTYVSHYIISRYDQTIPTNNDFSYHELKKKIDRSETIRVEDFSIEELLDDTRHDDPHASLRSEMNKLTDKLISQASEGRKAAGSQAAQKTTTSNPRSIFLTDQDDHRRLRKRVDTRKSIVTRAIQALVHQGTLIISPQDERRFALPNISTLGPKIVQIIIDRRHHHPSLSHIGLNYIMRILAGDQLWKAVHPHSVHTVLLLLQLPQTGPDSWHIPH